MRKFGLLFFLIIGCAASKTESFDYKKPLIRCVQYNPIFKSLAIGGNQDSLRILSGKDFQFIKHYPVDNTITKLAWHPHGEILAVARQFEDNSISEDESPFLLNTVTDSIFYLQSVGGLSLDWNFDGTYLAFGDKNGFVSIFNKAGSLVERFQTTQNSIASLSWHPTKNIIATVSDHIELYNLDSKTNQVINPRDEEIHVLCVAWHPSGEYFVTGDCGDSNKNIAPLLQWWNSDGSHIRNVEVGKEAIHDIDWNTDGRVLASSSDALRQWDVNGELIRQSMQTETIWGLSWKNTSNTLFTSDVYGRIVHWDKKLVSPKLLKY